MNKPVLTIVVPCFNEEEVLPVTASQLSGVFQELMYDGLISFESTILFVDDGSKDGTWNLIEQITKQSSNIEGLKLAANAGHQNALIAGLEAANKRSDCVVSIDADLQDDIGVIRTFVEKFIDGFDIVYGVRDHRSTDTLFKRSTAVGFYRLMNRMGIHLIPNHADFRLMSKQALDELLKYKETNLFLRGLVPLIGFPSTKVYYDRKERLAGESKYPLKKMLAFAFDGITSFSVAPIRFVTMMGFLSVIGSVAVGFYILIQKFLGQTETGWTSLMISIWFVGGLQLMGIGIIGEYIGKIYQEVKHRPRFAVEKDTFSNHTVGKQLQKVVLKNQ
ncbi:glycosyltransferase family 2 protein [Cytobacillus sp. Hz8]|uniref:glycosyltransferase family 2 protein n=1 Tax=Cytobacillus sp. Hz8 TaxID=3347168 RepID=UPI0035D6A137